MWGRHALRVAALASRLSLTPTLGTGAPWCWLLEVRSVLCCLALLVGSAVQGLALQGLALESKVCEGLSLQGAGH